MNWEIEGDYLENCNCEMLCPCIIGPRSATGGPLAEPSQGHCDVPMVFQINTGHYGEVALDGLTRRAGIPGVLEVEIVAVEGADGDAIWLDNVKHPVANRLAIAKAIKGWLKDHGFDWDNSNLNAHYAAFN